MRSVFSLFAFLVFIFSTNAAIAQRTPLFRDLPSGPVYVGPHSEPDLSSREAHKFRTSLREAAREDVNFAGHYRVVTWGCGTGCTFGAAIDVISGRVTFFPFSICCSVKVDDVDFQPVLTRPNSRLIVFVGMRGYEPPDAAHYYELTGRGFVHLASSTPFAPPAPIAAQEPRSVPLQEALPDYHPSIPTGASNQVTWKANGEIAEAPQSTNTASETTAPAAPAAPAAVAPKQEPVWVTLLGVAAILICLRLFSSPKLARSQTALATNNQRVVIVQRGSPGLMAGMMACIFAVLGIFTLGFIFVPIAAICSLIGVTNGAANLSASGFLVSLLGAFLTVVGFLHSPVLWLILGVGAAATMGH